MTIVVDDRVLEIAWKSRRHETESLETPETLINDESAARNMTVAGFSRAPSENGEISINTRATAKPGDGGDGDKSTQQPDF